MADHGEQHQPSASGSSRSDGRELVLVARGAAFGLPTACPDCLPAYLYLRMAGLDFSIHYNNNLPDSDDLPSLEYGDLVTVASNAGGFIEFLKRQNLADLDAGFSSPEVAELRSLTAMVDTYLKAALLCELWDNDNVKVANQIYFSALPGPINKFLYWKQHLKVNEMLCLKTKNREGKVAELYRKAAEAYESLSVRLGDETFFMKKRPSSLDAFFLSHALFVLHLPLEGSKLKEEFSKHVNLVNYAAKLQKEFLQDRGLPPVAQPVFSASRTRHSSSSHKPPQEKVRSEKEKRLKRRAKYFLAAQFAAIVGFVLVWGFVVDESLVEYEGGDAEGQGPGNQPQVASQ